jgi:hypothetical protein
MNDVLRRRLNVGHATLEGLDLHDSLWSGNPLAVTKRDLLSDNIDTVNDADTAYFNTSGTGFTDVKTVLKHELVDLTDVVGKGVCAYALDQGDLNTYSLYHHNHPYLDKLNEPALITYAQALFAYATPIAATLLPYNLTAGQITALGTKKTEFETARSKPRENISDHKGIGATIVTGLDIMNTTLGWWDMFYGTFRLTNPAEYGAYQAWRTQVDTGVRHLSLRGKVTGSVTAGALYRAKITITSLPAPKVTFSGKHGDFRFYSLDPGEYDIQVELFGYQTLVVNDILIEEGKITTRDLALTQL